MIVSAREARAIARGAKCQHRLPRARRAPEVGRTVPISFRHANEALGYDAYGQPRTELERVCEIEVCERFMVTCGVVSADDIEAEGYRDLDDFQDFWPRQTELVWVIRFTVRHSEPVRLLSGRVIAGRQGDYVSHGYRALRDELPAVDVFTQEEFSRQGRARDIMRELDRRDRRNELPFAVRLRALETEARRRHIDIRDELRAIRRWSNRKAQERQLELIAHKLDHPLIAA